MDKVKEIAKLHITNDERLTWVEREALKNFIKLNDTEITLFDFLININKHFKIRPLMDINLRDVPDEVNIIKSAKVIPAILHSISELPDLELHESYLLNLVLTSLYHEISTLSFYKLMSIYRDILNENHKLYEIVLDLTLINNGSRSIFRRLLDVVNDKLSLDMNAENINGIFDSRIIGEKVEESESETKENPIEETSDSINSEIKTSEEK